MISILSSSNVLNLKYFVIQPPKLTLAGLDALATMTVPKRIFISEIVRTS